MAEHLEKLDSKTRYRKPKGKTKINKNASSGAAAAIDRSRGKTGKSFRRGDTNRQVENLTAKTENADAKTWVEVNGKMVQVSSSKYVEGFHEKNNKAQTERKKRVYAEFGMKPPKDEVNKKVKRK